MHKMPYAGACNESGRAHATLSGTRTFVSLAINATGAVRVVAGSWKAAQMSARSSSTSLPPVTVMRRVRSPTANVTIVRPAMLSLAVFLSVGAAFCPGAGLGGRQAGSCESLVVGALLLAG